MKHRPSCKKTGSSFAALAAVIWDHGYSLILERGMVLGRASRSLRGITSIQRGETIMANKTENSEGKAVAPWKPFMDLSRWELEMDRMMDEYFGRRTRPWWPASWLLGPESEMIAPAVDFFEDKNDIVVKAELPGLNKDEVEVNLSDHSLMIKVEKKKEEEIKEENYYSCERSYGTFLRTVELRKDVYSDKGKAVFKNGVLEVRLPKSEEARGKEIKVNLE
jgi:HSP20 family protein